MSRGSVKTISDAIRSDGTATRRRLARSRRSTGRLGGDRRARARLPSPVEPRGHEPAAGVVAHVRRVVLERALPDRYEDGRRHLHVVLLLGEVALDIVD